MSLAEEILSFVSSCSLSEKQCTRKEIQNHLIRSHVGRWTKEDVKIVLKELISHGKLHKRNKMLFIPLPGDDNDSEQQKLQPSLPIAEMIRQARKKSNKLKSNVDAKIKSVSMKIIKNEEVVESNFTGKRDLDEEIRRLEAELAADFDSEEEKESVDYEDSSESHGSAAKYRCQKILQEYDKSPGIICLSSVANERIEPLPDRLMPQITRGKLDRDKTDKRRREKDQHKINEGLNDVVQELLSNYKSRSEVQQTPWYCRVCQHQAKDEAGFLSHRASTLHKAAVKHSLKKTYCKLCKKQMTSVIQMQEHLTSRPHREMLNSKKKKQELVCNRKECKEYCLPNSNSISRGNERLG